MPFTGKVSAKGITYLLDFVENILFFEPSPLHNSLIIARPEPWFALPHVYKDNNQFVIYSRLTILPSRITILGQHEVGLLHIRESFKRDALYVFGVRDCHAFAAFLPLPFPSANYRIVSTDDDDGDRPGFGLSD